MSAGKKVGIAFGVIFGLALLAGAVWLYIKRRNSQDDYNFGLPHQLASKYLPSSVCHVSFIYKVCLTRKDGDKLFPQLERFTKAAESVLSIGSVWRQSLLELLYCVAETFFTDYSEA
jgi:LPXTG-motif cell wall-anchored protein